MKKTLFLVILPLFFINFSNAQEICNDGIDNDGDGLIDCFDGDCVSDPACDGFYMGNDASCVAEPSIFPQFTLSLGYQSNNDASLNLSRIAIGDLDRDGIPEILSTNRGDDRIFILNGDDATIKHQANTNNPSFRSAAIANLQDDSCGEVFIINENNGSDYRIRSFDCELNELWVSERFNQDPVFVSFADFDRDGQPEMYYKDEIRDPITGTRIIQTSGTNWNELPSGGVAVDIIGDEDLELVLGNKIYAVELNSRTQDAGALTLLATMPSAYQTKLGSFASAQSSSTSIADYNLDGNLDIIITGADAGNVTTAFLWDVVNNTVKTFSDPMGTGNYQFGWRRGMGRVNIADIDGDGQLNATFVSGQFLYALDENWELLWRSTVNEETSGITGATLFDFNGDGKSEIVYRDEDYLYIMNGNDGSVNTQIHCRSRTGIEYPIVADVDADGSTEICVTCASENFNPTIPGRNLSLFDPAEVRVYKSGGEPWVPSRRVWNQHAYFNVNINDDLTVPQNQQKHQLVFSNGVCTPGPNRPLNSFLNQAPLLTSDGCYAYAAPELNLIESSLAINSSSCSSQDFTVSFDLENNGDVAISGQIPVTFYDGDPLVAGANKLNTELLTLSNFSVGETFVAENISVNGQAENFTLYAALNDNGSTTPSPISFPTTNFLECDYSNNIALLEVSGQTITSITQSETIISLPTSCSESTGQLEVEAVSSNNTSGFNFEWFQGSAATGTPFFTESGVNISQASNLTSGLYTVVATDIDNGCIDEAIFNLPYADSQEIDLTSVTNITSCDDPTEGEIAMELIPVSLPDVDESNYIIRLYEGSDVSSSPIAAKNGIASQSSYTFSGLSKGDYTIETVGDESVGACVVYSFVEILENSSVLDPVINVNKGNSSCLNPNGQLTLSINGGEPVDNFDYEWYEGNTVGGGLQISNSHVANNLESATYTVLVTEKATGCQTIASSEVPDETVTPVVNATATDIACSDTDTGVVSALVGGETTGYTFEWYIGTSEKPTADYTTSTVSNLPLGSYTVKATNDDSDCESALVTVVVEQTLSPEIEAISSTENNSCDPSQPNGTVTVSIVGEASEHTIEWFAGASTTGTAIGDTLSLSDLGAGEYTVKITNDNTGCFVTDRVTVVNNIVQPNLMASSVPVTTCSPFNGRIEASIDLDEESDYTFSWYRGSEVKATADFSETGNILDELEAGFYTVQALHNTRNCLTDPVTIEVVDEATFSANILSTVNEDYGSVANGRINIGVDKADRAYEVFLNQQAYKIFNTGLSELEITNLTAGVYEIKVVDTTSACSVNLSTEIFTKPNTATDILSFSLPNSTSAAVIDTTKHTVEIEVEGLTDITSVVPEIEISEEASISPDMEEARDFTEIVVYTVTAGDSTTLQNWEVTVTKAPILKEDQTITFNLPDTLNQDQSPYPLEASSSSGLPVRFSVESGSASILNGQLVLTRESEVTVKAYQTGNDSLNYAEVERTVTVLGSYDISVDILRPDDSALEEGLAKLFLKNGGMFQRKKFSNGDLEFTNVRAGEYILQIIPLGSATSDVFPTYYANTHFHKDASVLRVDNDMSLKVYMKEKTSASNENGNGKINGRVVKSEDSPNGRISLGKTNDGEGISELIVYLLKESTGEITRVEVTDNFGDFFMGDIPAGNYRILIDIPGLQEEETSFVLPYEKQNLEVSLSIFLNSEGIVKVDIGTILGNEEAGFDFNLYPNPTNGLMYLNDYTGKEQEVSIISANGAVVKTFIVSAISRQKIDLTDLKEGVYYLRFDNGKQRMLKIVKN